MKGQIESAGASALEPFRASASAHEAPVFSEAWHAQALAVADSLVRANRVTPGDWSAALGAALETTQAEQDDEATYYAAVLLAVETLGTKLDGMDTAALEARTEAWRAAYLSTPHGEPVQLADDDAELTR